MDIRVTRARKIFGDGMHNAFTGMELAFGQTIVAFRSGTRHVSPDGAIRLIASTDRDIWQPIACVRHPDADLRDPKMVLFGGRLLVYFAHLPPKGPRRMMRMESADGREFSPPEPLRGLEDGHWLWHVREFGGVLYGSAYRRRSGVPVVTLLESRDGLGWSPLIDFPVPGNETWLDFDRDGVLWALVRDDLFGCIPVVCTALPPYDRLDSVERLPMRLQGPMLKRLEGGCLIIGRQWDEPGWRNLRTDVLWLGDEQPLQKICTLPSGGDTSYADWRDLSDGRALVSYYSSHEHRMDPTMGDGEENAARASSDGSPAQAADIYLAHIAYRAGE
jgi:hypothetical protein